MRTRPPKPGKPAAKQGDKIVGIDTHVLMVPSPGGPVPTPTPMPFSGELSGGPSANVLVEGKPAAMQGSSAANTPKRSRPAGGLRETSMRLEIPR